MTKKPVNKRFKAHVVYKTTGGIVCPGASTVAGMLHKPALVHAAWKLGVEGVDYKKAWGAEADVGTIAHDMCECHIKGAVFDPTPYVAEDVVRATNAYNAFLDFKKGLPPHRTIISENEALVEGFMARNTSDKYMYGGTIDWVIEILDTSELWMFDFKSAKGIYDEHKYQTSAYFNLFHELNPGKKLSRVYLLQLGKNDGSFSDHAVSIQEIEKFWAIFWHLLQIYWLQKRG